MKYALVTGACGGLAAAAVEMLLNKGFTVFACDLSYKTVLTEGNKVMLPLDVTDATSIDNALNEVAKLTQTLDLVINLAGVVAIGSLVEGKDSLSTVLDVNVNGVYLVNKRAFPFIERGKGRIIIVTSEYGVIDGVPFHGFYTASKHALEAYADSLRRELSFVGIPVVIVRPGAFATPMQGGIERRFEVLVEETEHYKAPLCAMKGFMDKELDKAKSPALFAKTLAKACFAHRPRRYYRVNNSFKMKLLTSLPPALQDALYKAFLK